MRAKTCMRATVFLVVGILPVVALFLWRMDTLAKGAMDNVRVSDMTQPKETTNTNSAVSTNEANEQTKPLLILHIGPEKTNSSEIQHFAAKHKDLLQSDNIYFVGHSSDQPELDLNELNQFCTRSAKDMENCTRVWGDLNETLNSHHDDHHNVFLSHDWFGAIRSAQDSQDFVWTPLLSILPKWRVRVIFTYRRLHEWLPHNYYQLTGSAKKNLDSWPNEGREIPSFPSVYDLVIHKRSKHPRAILKHWNRALSKTTIDASISILNFHEPGLLLYNFFCKTMIPQQLQTRLLQVCHVAFPSYNDISNITQQEVNHHVQVSPYNDDLHYDMMAVAAYKQGWIAQDDSLSRRQVAQATKHYALALFYKNRKDYPLECINTTQSDVLLNASLEMELDMVPDFFNTKWGEQLLRFTLDKARKARLFCSIRVNQVLQDERWRSFYKNLSFESIQKQETRNTSIPMDYKDLDVNITFMGIGAQGAGTSWLAQMLRHSCPTTIEFGNKKEIHFWDKHRQYGLKWYSQQYPTRATTKKMLGEITPHYMGLSEESIQEVRLLFPNVKIIFLARDMVERTWSHVRKNLRHYKRKGVTDTSDPADFDDDFFLHKIMNAAHEERSNYDEALRKWYKYFPQEQVLIVNFQNLKDNPVQLMKTVLNFMEVPLETVNMTAIQEASEEQVNSGAYRQELRPSLRHQLEDLYRPHAHAFNLLLKEHGYTWRLDEYERNETKAADDPDE